MIWAHVATDLGDLICVSAVAAVTCFWVWVSINRLTAVTFAIAYGVTILAVGGLKLISSNLWSLPHDTPLFALSRGAPSGHAALSVFVYGAVAYFCTLAPRTWQNLAGQAACVLVIAGVFVTRVILHTHTVADVAAGAALGGLILAMPVNVQRLRPQPAQAPVLWLFAGIVAANAVMLLSGLRVQNDFGLL